jgi:hypothetical protein
MRTGILRNAPCSETAKLRSFAGLPYLHAERIRGVSWRILFSEYCLLVQHPEDLSAKVKESHDDGHQGGLGM